MTRIEIDNGDGTLRVDDVLVHAVPSAEAVAFVDQSVKDDALRFAARIEDMELLARMEACPVLSDDPDAIRVNFVTPDPELEDLLKRLGDDAWDPETGRMRAFMCSLPQVVDGRVYVGCGHFDSAAEQQATIELLARSALTTAQKRRLIKRVTDTPIRLNT
ncbi:MAG: hypothetical protein ACE37M_07905 [Henriciella sp.]